MPVANWFTICPYSAEAGISASKWSNFRRGFPLIRDEAWLQWVDELEPIWKQKWIANGIYNRTNRFDFRMDPMSPTVLDMAQVFGLRPSGKCVDITHDWYSPSCPITESSDASESITRLEYNSLTFKSYGKSFASFILFAKKTFCSPSSTADRAHKHMYFLLYWLNKHVFPNKSKWVKLEWIPLVEALHLFDDVATMPFFLAHLYHLLYDITIGKPLETILSEPTWMVQLWVQW